MHPQRMSGGGVYSGNGGKECAQIQLFMHSCTLLKFVSHTKRRSILAYRGRLTMQ